jgi:hypothetical protein
MKDGKVEVADFGLFPFIDKNWMIITVIGTVDYLALNCAFILKLVSS